MSSVELPARGLLFRFEGYAQVSVEQRRVVGFRQGRCPVNRRLYGTLHGGVAIARRDRDADDLAARHLPHLHNAFEARHGARWWNPGLLNSSLNCENVAVQFTRTHGIEPPLLVGQFRFELAPPFGLLCFLSPPFVLQPLPFNILEALSFGLLPLPFEFGFLALPTLLGFPLLPLSFCLFTPPTFLGLLLQPLSFDELLLPNSLLLLFQVLLPLETFRFDSLLHGGIRLRRFRLWFRFNSRRLLDLRHPRHIRLADEARIDGEGHGRPGRARKIQREQHCRHYQRMQQSGQQDRNNVVTVANHSACRVIPEPGMYPAGP